MSLRFAALVPVCAALLAAADAPPAEPPFAVWAADPLVKIFPDTPPPREPGGTVALRCARNEYEAAQIAVRPSREVADATLRCEALVREGGGPALPPETLRFNFVGFIPLTKNTPNTPRELLVREAPCEIPDPLLAERSLRLPAGRTQPVWLTAFVPAGAPAGEYRGRVRVVSAQGEASLPVRLTVWDFDLPAERHLFVTNWFSTSNLVKAHGLEERSEGYWKVLGAYFRDMAAHRQNVAWVPWSLVHVAREKDGRLSFDYADFDRTVSLMHEAGVADRIEIHHVARFGEGGWSSPSIEFRKVPAADRASGRTVQLGFEDGLAPLLGDLQRHLEEKGWLGKSMVHVADEPSLHNVDSWRERSRQVRGAAPLLRRIDAIEASDFAGDLEVWVPKLSHLRNWFDDYKRAQRGGAELWYYICCHPTGGKYPNRFLDYPLAKVRVLHWLNWAFGITGYLHWGLNFWGAKPFGPPAENLPPGDTHVVYPGPEGPLDSIRWEVQRDSLEDYEYLWLLADRLRRVKERLGPAAGDFDPAQRGRELCRRIVASLSETTGDPEEIRAARGEAAAEIEAASQDPPVLVWTRPPAGSMLVPGPITVEVYGAVLPGTQVKVNGAEARVSAEGRFARSTGLSKSRPVVTVQVSREGKSKTLVRSFGIE